MSNTQLHKTGQSWGLLGKLLGPLRKTGLLFMENVLKPLAESVLIPLGLTAATSATDAVIHKNMFGSGLLSDLASRPSDLASRTTTLIISNKKNQ